ncbi:hypothetical protein [Aquimarina algicola]|uniref:Lipoprotein n=1 Tax=Aquimarina algicola TaxID=2589995 RepID=A0A504JA66_9FLAO|nr:hypothetical protein [Aquimarina algicola]TPN85422.1 hypothetical protein FHK87_15520 [Aquimarina algicola]
MKTIYNSIFILFLSFIVACNNSKNTLDHTLAFSKSQKVNENQIDDSITYNKFEPRNSISYTGGDSLIVEKVVQINTLTLITGISKIHNDGVRLYAVDQEYNLLYQSKGQEDSWRLNLNFYKSKKGKNIVILAEVGAEESWGAYVYLYDGEKFKELDFLDFVALNSYKESQSIIPFLEITEKRNTSIQLSSTSKAIFLNNVTQKEVNAKDLIFTYHFEN